MVERDRVQKAIEGPVAEAVKLLDGARGADAETRLTMLINGWGRGMAAGLEELAIAIESLHRAVSLATPQPTHGEPRVERSALPESPPAAGGPDGGEGDEARLAARAAESRAETAALREEASPELNPDQEI